MTLQEYIAKPGNSAAAVARDVGCHRSYITRAAQKETLSPGAAIKIWRKRGVKVGPIAGASDDEIEVLARFGSERAA